MPELLNLKISDGFLSVWDLQENDQFFTGSINSDVLLRLQSSFLVKHRFVQKAAAHYILHCYNDQLVLDNFNRKPQVNHGSISISHCHDRIAVYYSRSLKVGIDLEIHASKVLKIRHKFLNSAELNWCGDDVQRCLFLWAVKESLFKKYGGRTSFFADTIHVHPFEMNFPAKIKADVLTDNGTVQDILYGLNLDNYVLVYTAE